MGITLKGSAAREPYWLEIGGFSDLKLKVRPLAAETVFLVNLKSDSQIESLLERRRELADLGGDVSALPDLSDRDQAAAFRSVLFLIALGQTAIVDWEGVFGDDGALAPVNDATIAELMRTYPVGVRFRDAYLAEHIVRSAEKNASAPLQSGISASAPAGASAADPADNHAMVKGAKGAGAHTGQADRKPPMA